MTLFDPAGPLFDGGPGSYSGANKDCAKSVVVIHGNPGRLGTVKNVGTVDIWPNCGCSVQPGCELTKTGTFPQGKNYKTGNCNTECFTSQLLLL